MESAPAQAGDVEDRTARNIGVGCFTTFIGVWSGAMVAVLIGRSWREYAVLRHVRGCRYATGMSTQR